MSDWFNDGPGFDFADMARLQSLANQGKITGQQKQILDELVRQKKDRERERKEREKQKAEERAHQASLPDCPFCGNKLPRANVSLCGHCRSGLFWHRDIPFQSQSAATAYEAAEYECEQQQIRNAAQREREIQHDARREAQRQEALRHAEQQA